MNMKQFFDHDKDSFLNIITQFETLYDIKNICCINLEISKFCNDNKNFISYAILKNNFSIVPFSDDNALTALKQYHKLNYNFYTKYLKFIIKNKYYQLLELLFKNKIPYFSDYFAYISSPNANLNIIKLIDKYNRYYIDILISRNYHTSIKTIDIKEYYDNQH